MKAALYVRVSSDDQIDNFSITAQINILNEYCKKNNITTYKIYADEGISAKFTDESKRPQFQQMLNDAEKKYFNIILVHKYDRFARNVELSQRVKRQLRNSGVNVISISEPIDQSPIGFITEGLAELLSEYYIRNLSMETKKGHLERARKGLHNGSVPYGYKIDHNHPAQMSINSEQAKIIEYIYDCYVNLGYGILKIAKTLNESGVISATGCKWCPKNIRMILCNPKYAGNIKLGNNIFPGIHDPIIDPSLWRIAQDMLKINADRHSYRGTNHDKHYLLGIGRCGVCGRAVILRTSNSKKYYVCSGYHRNYDKVCDNSMSFRAEVIEKYVMDFIKKECKSARPKIIPVKRDVSTMLIEERKKRLEKRLRNAENALLEGDISKDRFREEKNIINQELDELNKSVIEETIEKVNLENVWEEIQQCKTPSELRAKLKERFDVILISKDQISIYGYSN